MTFAHRFVLLASLLFTQACSSTDASTTGSGTDCPSSCQAAQAKSCTSIKGDCGKFCTSLDAVSTAGGCKSQQSAYQSCISANAVCTSDDKCASQKSALSNCAGVYCASHTADANCTVVVGSL